MDVYDTRGATRAISAFVDDLSQWWLRRSRRRLSRGGDATDRDAAFGTLHLALMSVSRTVAPLLPFIAEEFHQVLVAPTSEHGPESVHLTSWPAATSHPCAMKGWRQPWPTCAAQSSWAERCAARRA